MKFRTDHLISRIETIMAERMRRTQELKEQDAREAQEARDTWLREMQPHWTEFGVALQERLRSGEPVTYDIVPEALQKSSYNRNELHFHVPAKPVERKADIEDLRALKRMLIAVQDDHITTSGLAEIGFRDVASLFRYTS